MAPQGRGVAWRSSTRKFDCRGIGDRLLLPRFGILKGQNFRNKLKPTIGSSRIPFGPVFSGSQAGILYLSIKSTIIDIVMYAFLQLHQVVKYSPIKYIITE